MLRRAVAAATATIRRVRTSQAKVSLQYVESLSQLRAAGASAGGNGIEATTALFNRGIYYGNVTNLDEWGYNAPNNRQQQRQGRLGSVKKNTNTSNYNDNAATTISPTSSAQSTASAAQKSNYREEDEQPISYLDRSLGSSMQRGESASSGSGYREMSSHSTRGNVGEQYQQDSRQGGMSQMSSDPASRDSSSLSSSGRSPSSFSRTGASMNEGREKVEETTSVGYGSSEDPSKYSAYNTSSALGSEHNIDPASRQGGTAQRGTPGPGSTNYRNKPASTYTSGSSFRPSDNPQEAGVQQTSAREQVETHPQGMTSKRGASQGYQQVDHGNLRSTSSSDVRSREPGEYQQHQRSGSSVVGDFQSSQARDYHSSNPSLASDANQFGYNARSQSQEQQRQQQQSYQPRGSSMIDSASHGQQYQEQRYSSKAASYRSGQESHGIRDGSDPSQFTSTNIHSEASGKGNYNNYSPGYMPPGYTGGATTVSHRQQAQHQQYQGRTVRDESSTADRPYQSRFTQEETGAADRRASPTSTSTSPFYRASTNPDDSMSASVSYDSNSGPTKMGMEHNSPRPTRFNGLGTHTREDRMQDDADLEINPATGHHVEEVGVSLSAQGLRSYEAVQQLADDAERPGPSSMSQSGRGGTHGAEAMRNVSDRDSDRGRGSISSRPSSSGTGSSSYSTLSANRGINPSSFTGAPFERGDRFVRASQGFEDTASQAVKKATETVARAGDQAAGVAERVGERVANVAERVADQVSGVADRAQGVAESAKASAQSVSDRFHSTSERAQEFARDADVRGRPLQPFEMASQPETVETVRAAASTIAHGAEKLASGIESISPLAGPAKTILNPLSRVAHTVAEKAEQIAHAKAPQQTIGSVAKDVAGELSNTAGHVYETVADLAKKAETTAKAQIGQAALAGVGAMARDTVSKAAEGIAQTVSKAAGSGTIAQSVKEGVEQIGKTASNGNLSQAISEGVQRVAQAASSGNLSQALKEGVEQVRKATGTTTVQDAAQSIKSGIEQVAKTAASGAQSVREGADQTTRTASNENLYRTIGEGIQRVAKAASTGNVSQAITEGVEQIARATGNSNVQGVAQTIQSGIEQVARAASSSSNASQSVRDAYGSEQGSRPTSNDNVRQAISEGIQQVAKVVSTGSVSQAIKEGVEQIAKAASSNAGQGMAQTVKSGIEQVAKAAAAGGVTQTIKTGIDQAARATGLPPGVAEYAKQAVSGIAAAAGPAVSGLAEKASEVIGGGAAGVRQGQAQEQGRPLGSRSGMTDEDPNRYSGQYPASRESRWGDNFTVRAEDINVKNPGATAVRDDSSTSYRGYSKDAYHTPSLSGGDDTGFISSLKSGLTAAANIVSRVAHRVVDTIGGTASMRQDEPQSRQSQHMQQQPQAQYRSLSQSQQEETPRAYPTSRPTSIHNEAGTMPSAHEPMSNQSSRTSVQGQPMSTESQRNATKERGIYANFNLSKAAAAQPKYGYNAVRLPDGTYRYVSPNLYSHIHEDESSASTAANSSTATAASPAFSASTTADSGHSRRESQFSGSSSSPPTHPSSASGALSGAASMSSGASREQMAPSSVRVPPHLMTRDLHTSQPPSPPNKEEKYEHPFESSAGSANIRSLDSSSTATRVYGGKGPFGLPKVVMDDPKAHRTLATPSYTGVAVTTSRSSIQFAGTREGTPMHPVTQTPASAASSTPILHGRYTPGSSRAGPPPPNQAPYKYEFLPPRDEQDPSKVAARAFNQLYEVVSKKKGTESQPPLEVLYRAATDQPIPQPPESKRHGAKTEDEFSVVFRNRTTTATYKVVHDTPEINGTAGPYAQMPAQTSTSQPGASSTAQQPVHNMSSNISVGLSSSTQAGGRAQSSAETKGSVIEPSTKRPVLSPYVVPNSVQGGVFRSPDSSWYSPEHGFQAAFRNLGVSVTEALRTRSPIGTQTRGYTTRSSNRRRQHHQRRRPTASSEVEALSAFTSERVSVEINPTGQYESPTRDQIAQPSQAQPQVQNYSESTEQRSRESYAGPLFEPQERLYNEDQEPESEFTESKVIARTLSAIGVPSAGGEDKSTHLPTASPTEEEQKAAPPHPRAKPLIHHNFNSATEKQLPPRRYSTIYWTVPRRDSQGKEENGIPPEHQAVS